MKFKIIDIEQRSPEWHEYRKTHIMATDSAKILGLDPWADVVNCYDAKIEDIRTPVTRAMQRGIDKEDDARIFLSIYHNVHLKPIVIESIEKPFLAGSLDAVTDDYKQAFEIKCPGESTMRKAMKGIYSESYKIQCQKQMYLLDIDEMILFFYYNRLINHQIVIKRDNALIKKIIKADTDFYNDHLIPQIPPSPTMMLSQIEDENANILAAEWIALCEKEAEIAKEKKEIEAKLKELSDNKPSFFSQAGLRHTLIERKGLVDWRQVCDDYNISEENQEKYRKKSTTYSKFTIV